MTTKPLEGRVALVTGASSGIGEAAALALANAGAAVAIAARRADRLEQLKARIEATGGRALPVVADFADEEAIRVAYEQTAATLGGIDIVVNNAGVMLLSSVADARIAEWRRMIDINLLGLMISCKIALPYLEQSKAGHFVNLASVAGRVANPGAGVYAATKFGVVAFSEALRREVFSKNIRVTVVEPGLVQTELGDHITDPTSKESLRTRLTQVEALQAEDIAAAILYAVSQPSRVNVNEILVRPTLQER